MNSGSYKDLSGKRFERLTVTNEHEVRGRKNRKHMYWKCVCDCGNEVWVRGNNLSYGDTKSCGCLQKEYIRKTHGMSKTRLYRTYVDMHQRCENPNNPAYPDYGGRGISVCNEWSGKDGFVAFMNWSMNNGYAEDLSIDRVDVNGNYEPSNCRWATDKEQRLNKRNTLRTEFDGDVQTVVEISEKNDAPYSRVAERTRRNWDSEHILDDPPEKALIYYNGEKRTLRELSELTGIPYNTLCTRYNKGYSDKDIVEPYMHSIKKPTIQYDNDGNFIAEYESATEASRSTGLRKSGIIMCCNGQRKSCGGYKWEYKEQEKHIRRDRRKHRAKNGGWIDNRGQLLKEF